ncbi:MAG: hypothetical protein AAF789_09125, partial [Bacteroidota bacterium]
KLLGKKKKKSTMVFYADKAATQQISKIKAGQEVFYVKFPLNKKDFKMPLGKLFAFAEYPILQSAAEAKDVKNGYSKKDIRIYSHEEEISEPWKVIVAKQESYVAEIRLSNDINFENNLEDIVEAGSNVYPLTVWIGREETPFAYGVIDWDLTDGGDAYKASALAARANYTFKASDGVIDPDFKAAVKADIERRMNITIYQIAHGERVPYERDLTFYRRNQFGMTYKDAEDGKCYTGGISAFEVGSKVIGPFIYENDGTMSKGDEIPCDRVDK